LQLARSLVVVDEKEEISYFLGNWPLDNSVSITSTVSDEFISKYDITSANRAGQLMMKNPDTPITDWVSLAPDVNVRQFRLRLSIRQRHYQGGGRWKTILSPLKVEDHACWSCRLVFARRSH
jgi:hypothetical protein